MKSHEVRSSFINYFAKHQHQVVPSSSLVPHDDPTLLFTNAGMNQFKGTFMGIEPRDYNRAVSSQKCVRAGGKHNDLENVGHTARHHTFFEMLGNFSFGDYFKKDAIHFAWELVTKEWQLPKDRLYVTVFETDDEAAEIWHKQEGVPKERIYRFGEKDNFWRMGDSGPCGPCSEIFYDLGPEVGGDPKENVMGGSGDRFMEFWNLVFMQYFEDGKGGRTPLPNPSVDTGAGLERLTMIMQGQLSNYHTDLFMPLIERAAQMAGKEYLKDLKKLRDAERIEQDKTNVALRVMADHARATAFLLADGVLPSNEGRGYVLRRILRRGIRFARQLSDHQSLMPTVVEALVERMGDIYPELKQGKSHILGTVRDEESRFLNALDQGTEILSNELKHLESRGQKLVDGALVFKLYDTFGFPVDLTRIMATEKGFKVDESDFDRRMDEAKEKARASWKSKSIPGDAAHLLQISQELLRAEGATAFLGYETTQTDARAVKISDGKTLVKELKTGQSGLVAFNQTPFYAEGGGQVGDTGKITAPQGALEVVDCTKQNEIYWHHVQVTEGSLRLGDNCLIAVTQSRRRNTASNHSATHLLHAALRKVLGSHVTQAGSLVDAERLRFDFTHNRAVSAVEVREIEDLVNEQIQRALEVTTQVMSPADAMAGGALALFGEKYGDAVRVLTMGDFSMELCGGTHVKNTAFIRLFKVVGEGSVSAGVRRIEAITGDRAVKYAMKSLRENLIVRDAIGAQENWQQIIDASEDAPSAVVAGIEKMREQIKGLQREIHGLKGQQIDVDQILSQAAKLPDGKAKLLLVDLAVEDRKLLSETSDRLRDKMGSGIVVVVGQGEDSHPIIVNVSKDLSGKYHAGSLLKLVAEEMGGKGGGRPDFAQGAGKDRSRIQTAFTKVKELTQT